MTVTDPIADMLTRIRNAISVRHDSVQIPASNVKTEIARILKSEGFIENFPENQLSGSAHFWLGKIYLFESNYRKAAIVFGEGVQRFPQSIKAAEMYYELSKSLKEMNKFSEACKTLLILNQNYKGNKFTKDPDKIKDNMECESEN